MTADRKCPPDTPNIIAHSLIVTGFLHETLPDDVFEKAFAKTGAPSRIRELLKNLIIHLKAEGYKIREPDHIALNDALENYGTAIMAALPEELRTHFTAIYLAARHRQKQFYFGREDGGVIPS